VAVLSKMLEKMQTKTNVISLRLSESSSKRFLCVLQFDVQKMWDFHGLLPDLVRVVLKVHQAVSVAILMWPILLLIVFALLHWCVGSEACCLVLVNKMGFVSAEQGRDRAEASAGHGDAVLQGRHAHGFRHSKLRSLSSCY
jgi:hypothetical protein